ncbi:Neuronal acetylcholine receptor subunit alpha-9-II [Holothuria leucospilota]|uniref:Neuronal acetylcholine receptor subunit alpha-9-II n=1 Tax=Holothuria leucospilota TaxID=206669 RepID=A0A9Q1C1J5_HOLLE|nr:Neuronal acetylcholine receptor subunit alpha-9-II [Holothuria leucospilota]
MPFLNKQGPSPYVLRFKTVARRSEFGYDRNRRGQEMAEGSEETGISGVLCSLGRLEGTLKQLEVYCRVRCNVITVGEIDTVKQEFEAEVYLSLRWKEEAFKGKTREKLTIKLMSDWPLDVVEFVKDMSIKDSIRIDTFTGHHEWSLHKHVIAHSVEEDRAKTGSHRQYPIYHITTHVQRKPAYYMWNVALVIFLILGLSFTSFSVEADAPADRLSVTVTLLLTAVAFKFVVSSSLPTISYLTLLDKYVLWSLIFQCLMVVQNAVAVIFQKRNISDIFDYACMGVLGGFVLIGNIIFIITGLYRDLCEDINQRWHTRQQRKRDRDKALANPGEMPATEKPSQSSSSASIKKNQVAPSNAENGIEMKIQVN